MNYQLIQPKSPFGQQPISYFEKRNAIKGQQFKFEQNNDDTFDNVDCKLSRIIENERYSNRHLVQNNECQSKICELPQFMITTEENNDENEDDRQKQMKLIDPLETVNRLLNAEQKKKEKILNKQLDMYVNEIVEMQSGVKVNPKSEHILKNKNYQPIYLRTDEVISQKQEKLFKLYQQYQEEKELKDPLPSFQPFLESAPQTQKRTFQEFIDHMDNWIEKKNKNKQENHFQVVSQQMEKTTFKPQINKKSLQIFKEKNKNCDNIDLNSRMENKIKEYQERKKQLEEQVKNQYSYTPKINKKSKKQANNNQDKENNNTPNGDKHQRPLLRQREKSNEILAKSYNQPSKQMTKSKSSTCLKSNQSQIKNQQQQLDSQNTLQVKENQYYQHQMSNQQKMFVQDMQKIGRYNCQSNNQYDGQFNNLQNDKLDEQMYMQQNEQSQIRLNDISNNREEILRKLIDYDQFKSQTEQRYNDNVISIDDILQERQQNQIQKQNNIQKHQMIKNDFNFQNQIQTKQEQTNIRDKPNYKNNNNEITYFHARKRSSRSTSPIQNRSNISKTNHIYQQDQNKQKENEDLLAFMPSAQNASKKAVYHPNLDFIIGILSKKDKNKQNDQ